MAKLTISELQKLREKLAQERQTREGNARGQIIIHMGTCGIAAGARKVMTALLEAMDKQNVRDVIVNTSGCAGMCSKEPMATVQMAQQAPVKYISLNEEKIVRILNEHVLKGSVVKEYALAMGSERVG
ncbi:MAG: (2Fe-2S) ferredoxin domain-containing protein [Candidatus Sumerlaeia bacterium]|nr:(2Fe-2S) ferredoxin domain-containing protein [Candidatus Sumerlaeia bacterium]